MTTRKSIVDYCLTFQDACEDYPFHDGNWTVMRHKSNRKGFVFLYERDGLLWVNVKCSPEWIDFWRNAFSSVVPAYHMNKSHWNSIILDGTIPDEEIQNMIAESFRLTMPKIKKTAPQSGAPEPDSERN